MFDGGEGAVFVWVIWDLGLAVGLCGAFLRGRVRGGGFGCGVKKLCTVGVRSYYADFITVSGGEMCVYEDEEVGDAR